MIENMRTPNILELSPMNVRKTSKRILNQNALKFKLGQLKTTSIRYEVIYKNLVRDLRKYYSQDFNNMRVTGSKKLDASNFNQHVENYVRVTFKRQIEGNCCSVDDLIFNLGSLIYPKIMLKIQKNNPLLKV